MNPLHRYVRTTAIALALMPLCSIRLHASERGILTPPVSAKPTINGPGVYGARPGHPFLYVIPASGNRPMAFSANGLPPGLILNGNTGIITGSVQKPDRYRVQLVARNSLGTAHRAFTIIIGDKLALTPPMGWSSWYMAYDNISDTLVRRQVDALVSSGLINHGYSYVDIDDGWNLKPSAHDASAVSSTRTANGDMKPNSKFPDMPALAAYVHGKGLKIGIYTSPGPTTCGGYEGSYQHEQQDARLFASWGFDLLKYDLCSYSKILNGSKSVSDIRKPYQLMGSLLKRQNRDFLFNLCEYGKGDVWEWGREVGGNFWRTTGDVGSPSHELWNNVSSMGFGQAGMEKWAAPGGWNDPDNILIGDILWKGRLVPTPLTHNEQYTYVTLWSLLDAPLVFGGDMTQLDAFTLSLLTNDEVIAVNQDALGRQAAPVYRSGAIEIWAKDLEDGSKAVGLFNRGDQEATITVRWSDLGIQGEWSVRDLWRQRSLGRFRKTFKMSVGERGAEMILLRKSKPPANETRLSSRPPLPRG